MFYIFDENLKLQLSSDYLKHSFCKSERILPSCPQSYVTEYLLRCLVNISSYLANNDVININRMIFTDNLK